MKLEQDIRKEIYEYVEKFNLSDEEMKIIDSYVLELIKNFGTLMKTHDEIISDKEKINIFKTAVLENIGS